jgi:uncharacterized membrane protein
VNERTLRTAIAVVALAGIAVAAYLVVVHYSRDALICPTSGCETVQRSSYAVLFGIPVAVLGLGAFTTIFATALSRSEVARVAGVGIAASAALFAAYLVYVQLAVIDAVCVWCIGSDTLLAALVALTAFRAARAV